MAWRDVDLGAVSAYAVAVENGYQGTEEEWAQDMANAGKNAGIARTSAEQAKASEIAAKEALDALMPDKDKALVDIANAGKAQVVAMQNEGASQIQTVRDEGAEQKNSLVAQGEIQEKRVIAEGDAQAERVEQAAEIVVSAENGAQNAANAAAASAQRAAEYAEFAQKTTAEKGWMYVEGREDGNLYLVKSENGPDEITLKDDGQGRLVAVYG